MGSSFGIPQFRKMTRLQYPVQDDLTNPEESWWTARYYKGWDDLYIVGFWIIAFTFFRAFIMKGYFRPLGKHLGIRGDAKLERFEEQGYIMVYYIISWSAGMVSLSLVDPRRVGS